MYGDACVFSSLQPLGISSLLACLLSSFQAGPARRNFKERVSPTEIRVVLIV